MLYLVFLGQFDDDFEKIVTPVVFSENSEKSPIFYVFLHHEFGFDAYHLHSSEVKEAYGRVIDFVTETHFPKLVEELKTWESASKHHSVRFVGCRP